MSVVVIVHDIRSCHNVGSLLRTAEGLGVSRVYLTGYTPYPLTAPDDRLPHIARKLSEQIHKTALGAEDLVPWTHEADVAVVLERLRADGYRLVGLEQSAAATPLPDFVVPPKLALLLGREVAGIDTQLLARMDVCLEIPMLGRKESFNVVQAAAMALYECTVAQRAHPR